MRHLFGHPVILYGPEGAPAGGGAPAPNGNPGAPPGGGAPNPLANSPAPAHMGVAPPWGADPSAPWIIGDKPWFETVIPEGPTRDIMRAKNYANPGVLADSYHNLNKAYSSDDKRVLIPGPDAKPEDWDAFHRKLGRPDKATDYDFEKSLKLPEGMQLDTPLVEFGKAQAFKFGLSKSQAQQQANDFAEFQQKQAAASADAARVANDAEVTALETQYGGELNTKRAQGQKVVEKLGLSKEHMGRIEAHIGAAPLIDLLCRLGAGAGEGGFHGGGGGGDPLNPETMTPEAAASEITRLRGDETFNKAYTDKYNPGHEEAKARMLKLFAKAGPLAPM